MLKTVSYEFHIFCDYVPDILTASKLLNKRVSSQEIIDFSKGEGKSHTLNGKFLFSPVNNRYALIDVSMFRLSATYKHSLEVHLNFFK